MGGLVALRAALAGVAILASGIVRENPTPSPVTIIGVGFAIRGSVILTVVRGIAEMGPLHLGSCDRIRIGISLLQMSSFW